MGSSRASATCLRGILRTEGLEVAGVVTQPDRPAGRGKTVTPCPCKAFAESRGISPILTPENVNAPEMLALPLFGCFNCHFSLLPKYRGASPVASAIAAGDKTTGVTIMRMGPGMDDGPMVMQSYEPIYSDVTAGEMMENLAVAGGVTLAKALSLMSKNALPPEVPQNPAEATYCRKFKKTDGLVDWNSPVLAIERKIRAYLPWPGSYTFLPERFRRKGSSGRLAILGAKIVGTAEPGWREAAPGTVLKCVASLPRDARRGAATGPVVKCGDTALQLTAVKPEGGSAMDGAAFLAGRPLIPFSDKLLQA